jgi:hypothetical protein
VRSALTPFARPFRLAALSIDAPVELGPSERGGGNTLGDDDPHGDRRWSRLPEVVRNGKHDADDTCAGESSRLHTNPVLTPDQRRLLPTVRSASSTAAGTIHAVPSGCRHDLVAVALAVRVSNDGRRWP